jgi:hypothetical protein
MHRIIGLSGLWDYEYMFEKTLGPATPTAAH